MEGICTITQLLVQNLVIEIDFFSIPFVKRRDIPKEDRERQVIDIYTPLGYLQNKKKGIENVQVRTLCKTHSYTKKKIRDIIREIKIAIDVLHFIPRFFDIAKRKKLSYVVLYVVS